MDRTITISAYLSVRWMDEFRVWNQSFPYNCVDYIVLPADQVWIPDIAHMSADGKYDVMSQDGEKVRIYNNGYTLYSPGGSFQSYCKLDMTMFPMDIQTCTLQFESWRYTRQYMKFFLGGNVTFKYWIENEQWAVIGTDQELVDLKYADPANSFDRVNFHLRLKRKSMYYLINIVIPSNMIAFAHLATFTLPLGAIDKVEISFTCLLAYSVFQVSVSDDVPRSSVHIPMLSVYLDLQMGYIGSSMLGIGIAFVALSRSEETFSDAHYVRPVPPWILTVASLLAYVLRIGKIPVYQLKIAENLDDGHQSPQQTKGPDEVSFEGRQQGDILKPMKKQESKRQRRVLPTTAVSKLREKLNRRSKSRTLGAKSPDVKTATDVPEHDEEFDEVYDIRKKQWQCLAYIIDRVVGITYAIAIVITPIAMLAIHPAIINQSFNQIVMIGPSSCTYYVKACWLISSAICMFLIILTDCQLTPIPPRPAACSTGDPAAKATEQDIADRFFAPYGSWQRPRLNSSDPVLVNLTFGLMQVVDILETQRTILLSGYLVVRWMDEFRVWQHAFPYSCVDYVVLPPDQVWIPDVAQVNSDSRYNIVKMDGEKVRVYKNGLSWYSPGGTFKAYCQFDFTMFPFDTQTCALQIESWRYTRNYMAFQFGAEISLLYFQESEQWTLIEKYQRLINTSYLDPGNSFDHAEFYIVISRKSAYYVMNVIIPSILIAVAHLATFTLPLGELERINISFTCLLAYSVFQLMVAGDMPRSSVHIPLLSIYIDVQMGYITLSMIGEGICYLAMENVQEFKPNGEPGRWLSQTTLRVFSFIGRFLFVSPLTESQMRHAEVIDIKDHFGMEQGETDLAHSCSHGETSETGDTSHHAYVVKTKKERRLNTHRYDNRQTQWRYVGHVIERLNGVIYTIAIILTPIIMFTINPEKKK